MKIKMITLYAGPGGVMEPGHTYEVETKLGQALVQGRYALPAQKATPVEAALEAAPETASLTVESLEEAVLPAPHKGARKSK